MPCVTKGTWVTALYSSFCWQVPAWLLWLECACSDLQAMRKLKERSLHLPSPPGGWQRKAFAWQDSVPEACCSFQSTWTTAGSAVRSCQNEPTTNCFLCSQCKEEADREWHLSAEPPSCNPKQHPLISVFSWRNSLAQWLFLLSWGLCGASRGSWEGQQSGHPQAKLWLSSAAADQVTVSWLLSAHDGVSQKS